MSVIIVQMFPVSYDVGFLQRNFRGKWYLACGDAFIWANEACAAELGETGFVFRHSYLYHPLSSEFYLEILGFEMLLIRKKNSIWKNNAECVLIRPWVEKSFALLFYIQTSLSFLEPEIFQFILLYYSNVNDQL